MIARISSKGLLAAAVVVALVAAAFAFTVRGSTKTVTAYFSEAISVYKGTDVDVMGVRIGSVKAVVPDGDRVRVEIEYDGKYKLPADVKAAVITPTLVADRFVQLAPAYTGGRPSTAAARSRSTAPRCRSSSTRSTPASLSSRRRSAPRAPTRRARSAMSCTPAPRR